jgi:hypothetical protein
VDNKEYKLLLDVKDPAIFMLKTLPVETDPAEDLLCFYDLGCSSAGILDWACSLMRTAMVTEGPTVLDMAGAKSITIPYGDVKKFHVELDGTKQKVTTTCLRMANITACFPMFQLLEAWGDLNPAATRRGRGSIPRRWTPRRAEGVWTSFWAPGT